MRKVKMYRLSSNNMNALLYLSFVFIISGCSTARIADISSSSERPMKVVKIRKNDSLLVSIDTRQIDDNMFLGADAAKRRNAEVLKDVLRNLRSDYKFAKVEQNLKENMDHLKNETGRKFALNIEITEIPSGKHDTLLNAFLSIITFGLREYDIYQKYICLIEISDIEAGNLVSYSKEYEVKIDIRGGAVPGDNGEGREEFYLLKYWQMWWPQLQSVLKPLD